MRPRPASDDATAALQPATSPAPTSAAADPPAPARIDEVTFRTLFDTSPVGMCLVGIDGRPLRCNPAMVALLGYTEDELREMSFVDFTHPEDLPAELEQYQAMLGGRTTFGQLEKRYRRKDGTLVWVRVTASMVPEPEGARPRFAVAMIEDLRERKAAEGRLEAVLGGIVDHLVSYDGEWRYTYVNDGAERVLGKSREELLGRSIWEVFPDAVGNPYWTELHRARAEGQVRRFEHYYPPHDAWYENHVYPTADGVIVLAADVTRRKQAEAAARASDARYRTLFEDSPVSLWEQDFSAVKPRVDALRSAGVTDLEAHFAAHPEDLRACIEAVRTVEVNQAAMRMFGAPDKSALLDGPGPVVPPEAYAAFAAELAAFAAGAVRFQSEAPRVRLDGTPLLVDVHARIAPGAESTWERVLVSIVDLTERRAAERAARRNDRVYRAVGESIDWGIWICAPDGRNVYASPSFLAMVGMTQEQCSEFGWGDVLDPDDAEATIAAWKATVRDGTFWEREHRFRAHDGTWRHVLARGVPIRDEQGRIECWAGINLDITDRKAGEQALRDADRRKDEFLAVLAHELRNPLAPLRSATELLRLVEAGPTRDQALGVLERQLAHMVRLIDDLMDVSRISRGRIELQKAPVDLAAVIAEAIETTRPLLDAGPLALASTLAPGLIVDGDATRLGQVFANLLNNAAKYTPPGGNVRVAAERRGDEAWVSVRDDGIGISPESLPRVFEMFAQGDRTLEKSRGGLGIGLNLARRLAELHGGTIEARSAGPGRGSEFIVRLPLAPAAAAAPAPEPVPPPATDAKPGTRRILVADDNEDAAASLALMLRLMGHETRTARDGVEALEVAETFQPDVMLVDIGMPRLNGYDVARRVRAARGDAVRLVALTGWGQESDRRKSQEAGFEEHLVKPVDVDRLMALLAT
jgi:PAS domain S-box-containing protein